MDVRRPLVGVYAVLAMAACAGANAPRVTVLPPRLSPVNAEPSSVVAPPVSPAPTRPATGHVTVVETAQAYLGVPYVEGGSSPAGFDCSGFVWYVFARAGARLPRELVRQFDTGAPVALSSIAPGDLLFFHTTGPGPTHVGLSLGGDDFIHAPNSRGVVRIDHLSTPYWTVRFLGARRVPF